MTLTREQIEAILALSQKKHITKPQEVISLCCLALQAPQFQPAPFQQRVNDWMQVCFGAEISADKSERNHRFLEEALELVQALGCSKSEAHQLVDYVYGRPQGEVNQEVGGVMVTLAALCLASGLDMQAGGETELARVWTKVEKIRAKQAAKPKHSPLPAQPVPPSDVEDWEDALFSIAFAFSPAAHIAHDMRVGRFPQRSTEAWALAEMVKAFIKDGIVSVEPPPVHSPFNDILPEDDTPIEAMRLGKGE